MKKAFVAEEIVEIGIQIEINGKDFYDVVAKKSKDKKAKEIFKYLSGEELKHIGVFRDILGAVKQYYPKEAYPQEYFAYMNSIASGHIFTQKDKGKETAKSVKNEIEAVNLGIRFEKESIIFYEEMKKIIPEKEIKPLEGLIREEEKHLADLTNIKGVLT